MIDVGALLAAFLVAGLAWAPDATAQGNPSECAPGRPQLVIYHAGSLSAAFKAVEKVFTERTGICVVDVAGGSVDAARQITVGQRPCDIFASADYEIIDLLLKPARYADYTIRFAEGGMVLAYTTASRNAATIAAAGSEFHPPDAVPMAADDWYAQLLQPGVAIAGSHPFLDPSGYRADMMFQLAQDRYRLPDLYNALLGHYSISKRSDALGKTYDYQFIYEHSAMAASKADSTGTYRYVKLPDDINLSASSADTRYRMRGTTIPGLRLTAEPPTVRIPATRVTWGLTILRHAPNAANAARFLALLFSEEGVALQTAVGPAPISPPLARREDHAKLPAELKSVVKASAR